MDPVLETLERLQKKEASRLSTAGSSPVLNTTDRTEGKTPQGADMEALNEITRKRVFSRLQEAIQAIDDACPADFPGAIQPEDKAGLEIAKNRMDQAFLVEDYTEAEAALEAWGRLWLDTIKNHGGIN